MRQYLGIYNEALVTMRDINYLVAIDTRYIGEAAAVAKDAELIQLVYRFMNSYLRAALERARRAHRLQHPEPVPPAGRGDAAPRQRRAPPSRACGTCSYYGHVSFDMKLTFVTETVAYDVSTLCQVANELRLPEEDEMLRMFLELDRPLRVSSQETALLGVRKAQVKLAAYYLSQGTEDKARLIAKDMESEPPSGCVDSPRARERHQQGFLGNHRSRPQLRVHAPEKQRARLAEFFGWLNVAANRRGRQGQKPWTRSARAMLREAARLRSEDRTCSASTPVAASLRAPRNTCRASARSARPPRAPRLLEPAWPEPLRATRADRRRAGAELDEVAPTGSPKSSFTSTRTTHGPVWRGATLAV